jgi:hypothetical protein
VHWELLQVAHVKRSDVGVRCVNGDLVLLGKVGLLCIPHDFHNRLSLSSAFITIVVVVVVVIERLL